MSLFLKKCSGVGLLRLKMCHLPWGLSLTSECQTFGKSSIGHIFKFPKDDISKGFQQCGQPAIVHFILVPCFKILCFRFSVTSKEEGIEQEPNPANFGSKFARQCICEVPGHVPCPGWQPLPLEMTGKGRKKLQEQAEG